MGVDGREDALGELLVFEQAAKLEQRRGVRRSLAAQVSPPDEYSPNRPVEFSPV